MTDTNPSPTESVTVPRALFLRVREEIKRQAEKSDEGSNLVFTGILHRLDQCEAAAPVGEDDDGYTDEDMAVVGRSLMDELKSNAASLKGWICCGNPAEIVVDLINARDELQEELDALKAQPSTPTARKQALEEAAKMAEDYFTSDGNYIADRIRALAKSSPPTGETRDDLVGKWLSAALDDPKVCAEMKADINAWFNTPASEEGVRDKLRERLDGAIKFYAERPCVDADERCPAMEEMSLHERVDLRLLLKDVRAALPSTPAPQRQRIGSRTWDAYDLKYGTNCRAKMRAAPHRQTVDDAAVERALAAWYPGEWPDDPAFAEFLPGTGRTFATKCREEMRAALLAAFPQEN